MSRRMNRIYLGLFLNFPQWNFSELFFPDSGHIEDTKSFEFASVAICLTFVHEMTGLPGLYTS